MIVACVTDWIRDVKRSSDFRTSVLKFGIRIRFAYILVFDFGRDRTKQEEQAAQ